VFKKPNYQQARKQKAQARKARQDEKQARRSVRQPGSAGDTAEQSPTASEAPSPVTEDAK
jgi:hypothetical protein